MAKAVIRCQYTGHYLISATDTDERPATIGGSIFCPYCGTQHVWIAADAREGESDRKLLVRQAS